MNTHDNSFLHDAIRQSKPEKVAKLIAQGCDVNAVVDQHTPLLSLTLSYGERPDLREQYIVIAKQLLETGADPNISSGVYIINRRRGVYNNNLPLAVAVRAEYVPLVELFLHYQADPNKSEDGTPLLIFAMRHVFNNDVIRLLLTKADPMLPDPNCTYSHTPFVMAISVACAYPEDENVIRLKYLLMHPKFRLESRYKDIIYSQIKSSIFKILEAYTKEQASLTKTRIAKIIQILILGGFSLYKESIDEVLQYEDESLISREETAFLSLHQNAIEKKIRPFFEQIIEDTNKRKAIEIVKLGGITDPQIVKQFLLASKGEKAAILEKISTLESVLGYKDTVMTTRFLLSSTQEQEDFLSRIELNTNHCKNIDQYKQLLFKHDQYSQEEWQERVKNMLLLKAALDCPNEVFNKILKYLLTDPNDIFMSTEKLTSPVNIEEDFIEPTFASLRIS